MNFHFKLCDDCNEEVAIKNGKKYDFSYYDIEATEHTCMDKQMTFQDKNEGLIRGNA